MIKQFFKKVLISYLIIICCIYTPAAQAANWSFGGYNFSNRSLNIVKDGVKITTAAVDAAPITSNLGAKILGGAIRGANILTAISVISGLGEDAIDWVLDPANNTVKYKTKNLQSVDMFCDWFDNCMANVFSYSTADAAGKKTCANYKSTFVKVRELPPYDDSQYLTVECRPANSSVNDLYNIIVKKRNNDYKTIPVPTVATKIYDIAKSGNANAQADVTSSVSDLVNSGVYNIPISQAIRDAIDSGVLPKDTVVNNSSDAQIDTSSITAAIQSLASAFASAISDSFNGITSVINTSMDKLLNKQEQMQGELVNVGSKVDGLGGQVVGVGDKVDNVGGKVVGVGDAVNDVGGKVVGLNDSVDKIGDKVVGVGDKVDAAGDKVGTKVDAVGDKVVGVGDKVDAVGDKVGTKVDAVGDKVGTKVDAVGDKVGTKVDAVGEKVTTVGEKVTTVGEKVTTVGEKVTTSIKDSTKEVTSSNEKVTEAVKESTKEITRTIKESKPKDFELPAFCSWASKVCDFIDWVKKDPDLPQDDNTPLVKDEKDSSFVDEYANKSYVNFSGQCPAPPVFNIFGGQIIFPMEIVCKACEQMSWVFISFAWLRAVMIVFFASKG